MEQKFVSDTEPQFDLTLPLLAIDSRVFPSAILNFEFIKSEREEFFKKVINHPEPKCFVATRKPEVKNYGNETMAELYNIGVISRLKLDENKIFELRGETRAKLINLRRSEEEQMWYADVKILYDEPELDKIPDTDLPMILGAAEAVSRSLKKLSELLSDSEEEKQIKTFTDAIGMPRSPELIYSLPWNLLFLIRSFIPEKFAERIISTDRIVDRLQGVLDAIKLEIQVRNFAEALDEELEMPTIKQENKNNVGNDDGSSDTQTV